MIQLAAATAMIGIWILIFPLTTKEVSRSPWLHVLLGAIITLLSIWSFSI